MVKKKQEIFIESFRHRRVSAEIGKTAKEVSQFVDSGGSSLISGGLNFDCYTPGGPGGLDNPCPPQTRIAITEQIDDFVLSEAYSLTYCTFTNKLFLTGASSLITGRNGPGGSTNECGSSNHNVEPHYFKWVGTLNAFDDVYDGYQLAAKGRWSTNLPDQVLVDVFINLPDDPSLYTDCDTDLSHWTDGQYAGTMEFNMTVQENRGTGTAKFDDQGTTLTISAQPTTPWLRFEMQGVDSAAVGQVFRPMDYEIAQPDLGDQMVRMYALDIGVVDTTDYSNSLDFRNGYTMTIGTQADHPGFGQIPVQFPGTSGWFNWNHYDDNTVPITVPAFKSRNAFAGFIQQSNDPSNPQFNVGAELWYSGCHIRRLDFKPSFPPELYFQFVWLEVGNGAYADVGWKISPIDPWGTTPYREVQFEPPFSSSPGKISINGGVISANVSWTANVIYSCRIITSATTQQVWLWDESETEPLTPTLTWSVATAKEGGISITAESGQLGGVEKRSVVKFISMFADGIAVLDCNRVTDSEGNLMITLDEFGYPIWDPLGEWEEANQDALLSANLSRISESRYVLPSDADQIQNLWVNGVHAEPNLHYTFTPPRLVIFTHTLPVGTQVTAEYLSLGGTT